MKQLNLYTIGFTKKTAEQFFTTLQKAGVQRIIDTRLNNVSQLAGFAKRKDLEYFLKTIGNIEYTHIVDLAPTQDILDQYKKQKGDWDTYETQFNALIKKRKIEQKVTPELLNHACLLCSEPEPHHCHRRLVAEYLEKQWGNVLIHHL
ncbi:DUF488 domain-containing protein [Spirulina subsalsa FACHB-351]|uniref:DUF488 domain-containing protein n=1 Tax=Spirulina subsalsa FACHB-351 TaxID=234711 RepID=A0ABT3L500_9CYAN|nr:DUF488 domain-containing protein [Spirulina subsalsa]MCW6036569.1 DUF488 domain-containing protein [Spirulina subsalsa FACHB-351]